MSSHLVRLASFAAWPSTASVLSLALARSGFKYTGHGESTVCTECQLVVDSWQHGDLPDQVHRQRSPNCPFVQEQMQSSDSSISRPAAASAAEVRSSQNYNISVRAHCDQGSKWNKKYWYGTCSLSSSFRSPPFPSCPFSIVHLAVLSPLFHSLPFPLSAQPRQPLFRI